MKKKNGYKIVRWTNCPPTTGDVIPNDIVGDLCSVLHVETADRPGLIVGIVKVLGDLSINVESAEIDTEVSVHV